MMMFMLEPVKGDWHLHSNCSDGKYTPEQVVKKAADIGLKEISITDHNTLNHLEEAQKAADEVGITLIPGCEITAHLKKTDFHILAYGFKKEGPLRNFFELERKKQERRAERTAKKLMEIGYFVDLDQIRAEKGNAVLGRLLLVKFILSHPRNADLLFKEKIKDIDEFYARYLRRDCLAYVPRKKPGIRKVIKVIKSAGGIAVWAHPIWTINEYFEKDTLEHLSVNFKKMLRAGIDGLEVFYPGIKENLAIALYNMCWKHRLLVTAGSDWHGEDYRKGEESAPGLYPVFNGIKPDLLSKFVIERCK